MKTILSKGYKVLSLAFVLAACGTNTLPAASTVSPTRTIREQAIATSTEVSTANATITQQPTSTPANLRAEEAPVFAEPILADISGRSPDFEEDFSNPNSGWPVTASGSGRYSGTVGYKDGEYFLIADPASAQNPHVHSWLEIPRLSVSDFVMEFDTNLSSAQSGTIYLHFRTIRKDHYSLNLASDGWVHLATSTIDGDTILAETTTNIITTSQNVHVRIIAQGSQIALYLNDQLILLAREEFVDQGEVILGIWNGASTPMQVNFDNFKVWDTSDLTSAISSKFRWEKVYDNSIFQQADVASIAIHPHDPNLIYAATTGALDLGVGAGIYASTDGGKTWTAANTGLEHVTVSGIFIDPEDTQTLFVTTFGAGPYKSTDGGAHWRPINAGLSRPTGTWNGVSSLVFDPNDHLRIYHIDAAEGLFHSVDGGETWQLVSHPCQTFTSIAINPRDGNHLFVGTFFPYNVPDITCPGGLYESTDGGQNWTSIAQDIPDIEKAGVWRVVIDSQTPDHLYATLEYAGTNRTGLVIASTNGGKDWTVLRNAGWRAAIAVNPNDSLNLYVAEGSELHRSDDGGRTWTALGGDFGAHVEALVFSRDTLYVGATGVYRTTNGGQSWETSTSGFGSAWLELTFEPARRVLYAEDNDCNLYKSQDAGMTWEKLTSSGCGLAFDRANNWLYRADWQMLYRSSDAGETWTGVGKTPSGGDNSRVYVSPVNGNTIYTLHSCCPPGPFLHRSLDGGQTWQPLPTASDLYHGRLVIADDGSRMYVASYGSVDVSYDGGQSWSTTQASTHNNGNPPALALHPLDRDIVLLGTWGSGILKSMDAGETWSTVNTGLASLHVNALTFDPRHPEVVYAGTDSGVFLSQNGGDSWTAVNDGLGRNLIVYSIAVDPNDSLQAFAGTPDGVYRLGKLLD